jgi:hypothetical protein
LTKPSETGKFLQVAPQPARKGTDGVRLILENSTVCHSRRISLLCPVDSSASDGGWVDGFFDNDSDNFVSVVCQASLFLQLVVLWGGWLGVLFSTESLILAQDERWRRA